MIASAVSLTDKELRRFNRGRFSVKHGGIEHYKKVILTAEVLGGIISVGIDGPNPTSCQFNPNDFFVIEDMPDRLHLLSKDNKKDEFILFTQPQSNPPLRGKQVYCGEF